VKGSSSGIGARVRIMTLFAAAFMAGAGIVFGLASLAGTTMEAHLAPAWRAGLGTCGLTALAFLDFTGIRRRSYCPLGWRRQTPQKAWVHRYGATAGVTAWGFDTGLAVTTFRVAALTWGALALTALGFSSWRTGLAYGIGFIAPLMILLMMPADRRRLEWLILKRPAIQFASAAGLLATSALLLRQFL
jgi:hypothetical protein